jgi:hypothetical protein
MRCPKCQFDHPLQTTECLKCGIVFARYLAVVESAAKPANVQAPVAQTRALSPNLALSFRNDALGNDALWEFKYRIFALPLALLIARLVARSPLGMLAMVLHESGHAITAWLTGRWAVPLLWVTMHGEERSWWVVLAVTSAIIYGGFLAWKSEQRGWLWAAGAMLIVQLIFLRLPAGSSIVFGGDAGALVLATVLMATFYAPRESAICRSWGLRWGLLVIGAISFMQVFLLWSGPLEDIPFGEIEGVNLSDPSLLTTVYGWSVEQLVDRYMRLATVCLVILAGIYVWDWSPPIGRRKAPLDIVGGLVALLWIVLEACLN